MQKINTVSKALLCLLSATPGKENAQVSDVQDIKKYKGNDVFLSSVRDLLSKEGPLAYSIVIVIVE